MNDPSDTPPAAVVIGASVGAVHALGEILPKLSAGFPLPVLVVVHVPRSASTGMSDLFARQCRIAVKEAEDKELVAPATVYFAPPDYHLLVEPDFRLSLSSDEPVFYSRPAVDVLFESAADAWGDRLTGVILTGANTDGAAGLAAVCRGGGRALIQDPATAEGAAMPRAALAACPSAEILPLHEIPFRLEEWIREL